MAAASIVEPGGRGMNSSYLQPDLWWPEDRSWFVSTDVDFWSTYVAGGKGFTAEVAAAVPTPSEPVPLEHPFAAED